MIKYIGYEVIFVYARIYCREGKIYEKKTQIIVLSILTFFGVKREKYHNIFLIQCIKK